MMRNGDLCICTMSLLGCLYLPACNRLAGPPDVYGKATLAARLTELSPDCTPESCIPVIAIQYGGGSPSIDYDVPDSRFYVNYSCSITTPAAEPVLASAHALAQIERECREYANNAHLIFPHWWETECFFDLEYPDYGAVVFPDYVEDPADYLYVACQLRSWAYEKGE